MTEPLTQGDQLGDFEIVSVAGTGGMGVVYKAKQKSLARDVALKVIRDEIATEDEFRQRFMREARLAASVDHPNVVTVYDVGSEDDRLYLVMQWIDGSDVKEQLRESGRFPPKRAVAIGSQIAGALDALHSVSGLIHRDVKPANVLLRTVGGEDHAYLTDFGIAKPPEALEHLTKTGSTVGTTGYLSPEQIQGGEAGPRSDLYALGCLVFEMLTGRPPFAGENELAVRWAHANDPRPLVSEAVPALGQRYDEFFAYALAVDPAERFGSGCEFAEALTAAMTSESTTDATAVISQPRAETKIGPPTPLPPGRRPPTPPPGYQPAYGYATPPPAHARSGNPLALILLALVAIAGIAVGALAAAGVFSSEGSTTASHEVPSKGKTKPVKAEPKDRLQVPASAESCASGLWVNDVTSCEFAENTRSAYAEANGAKKISSYSPVTGQTYAMTCEGSGTVVCRGGDHASLWFTSAKATGQDTSSPPPEPAPEAETSSAPDESLQACDPNISANSVTSCDFAENVFVAYWEEYDSYGEQYETYVLAYSPATDETYGMECLLESDVVDCYGGEGAFVTFPMWAVRVY